MSTPPLIFFSLTPDEDDYYPQLSEEEEIEYNWLEDSECQENLFNIVMLTPEESIIDQDNHIQNTTFKLFFEELGYLTEEPEPIDPSRDYEQEAKELAMKRNKKVRQNHIPSLDYTSSGVSSSSSSIHHDFVDIRSPHFMGSYGCHPINEHSPYSYGHHTDLKHFPHQVYRPSRLNC